MPEMWALTRLRYKQKVYEIGDQCDVDQEDIPRLIHEKRFGFVEDMSNTVERVQPENAVVSPEIETKIILCESERLTSTPETEPSLSALQVDLSERNKMLAELEGRDLAFTLLERQLKKISRKNQRRRQC